MRRVVSLRRAVAPVYLSEIAAPEVRGRLVTANEVATCVGCLTASVVNAAISSIMDGDASAGGGGHHGWRWMMG